MRRLLIALVLSLSAALPVAAAPLDDAAAAYVKLVLGVGEHEDGYVDAYYGPAEVRDSVRAAKPSLPVLAAEADRLSAAVSAVDAAPLSPIERKRRAFLAAQLKAVKFRIGMIQGAKPTFQDEAEALFGVKPTLKPLSAYDPLLAKIEAVVPGDGPLADRVDAFKMRYAIPKDRLEPVMRAAIAECRARTAAHFKLPPEESFVLEFVNDKSWSGYNWYQGKAHSLIQVNTDLPIFVDRAVDLGCHEGYPGHHTHNALLEDRLVKSRGWVEFSVYPLFSPLSLIAEGEGNYGIDLAFPGKQRTAFEAKTLYPLAGLDPNTASAYSALREAVAGLTGARLTITADLLNGKIDRKTAISLMQKYQLVSRARAEQSIRFSEGYRSYVLNYVTGQEMVKAKVERAGSDPAARWKAMETILSEPTLPADLLN